MPSVPFKTFGPPQPEATQGGQREKMTRKFFMPYLVLEQSGAVYTNWIRTLLVVGLPADHIFDPADVGRGACEYRGLFIHCASILNKACYPMNFPGSTCGILAHERTA